MRPNVPQTQFTSLFEGFAARMDSLNLAREEVYKLSRDITAASKRVISLLQRMRLNADSDSFLETARSELKQVHGMLRTLTKHLASSAGAAAADTSESFAALTVAPAATVPLPLYWQFYPRFSFGLQEYVEAYTFYHYLRFTTICTEADIAAAIAEDFAAFDTEETEEAAAAAEAAAAEAAAEAEVAASAAKLQATALDGSADAPAAVADAGDTADAAAAPAAAMSDEAAPAASARAAPMPVRTPVLPIPPSDYLLGLFDLTGELMRFGVLSAPTAPGFAAGIAAFISALSAHIVATTGLYGSALRLRRKDLDGKLGAMRASLQKVEEMCYKWQTRMAEFPPEVAQEVLQRLIRAADSAAAGNDEWSGGGGVGTGAQDGGGDDF
jgi:predicted translin family RNA/ssDNA-binding protein